MKITMSRLLALLGLVLFAASLLTALRSRLLARIAGRLSSQYRGHHALGVATALMLAAHVIWELLHTPPSLLLAMIITSDPALLAGWFALIGFCLAFLFSYQRQITFRSWRLWHWLFPIAFVMASIHGVIFARDEAPDQGVIWISLGLGLLGLVLLATRSYWNPWARRYCVHALRPLTGSVWELLLEPKVPGAACEPCRAGQVVYLRFGGKRFSRSLHPFTVASCQREPYLRLLIKSLGRDTSHLQELSPGDEVEVLGPFAELKVDLGHEQIWIGGGMGIAPFLGFLHCLQPDEAPGIHVLHFVARPEERLQAEERKALQARLPNLTWQDVVDQPGARPSLAPLDSALRGVQQPRIVICGPDPFMRMVRLHLERLGVSARDIVTEEFIP